VIAHFVRYAENYSMHEPYSTYWQNVSNILLNILMKRVLNLETIINVGIQRLWKKKSSSWTGCSKEIMIGNDLMQFMMFFWKDKSV
jgi:hypothetical protein